MLIELNEGRTDCTVCEDFLDEVDGLNWQVVAGILKEAKNPLTRQEMLDQWPEDFPIPNPAALWKWLDRAVKDGRLCREGTGRRNCPYRYGVMGGET